MHLKHILVLLTTLYSLSSLAGGGATGGATEITQIMNNGELVSSVSKQAQMVAGQLQQYALQTQQYMTQLQNLKNISLDSLTRQLAPYQSTLGSISRVYDATMQVYNTSTQAQQVYQNRLYEMQSLKMNPQEYLLNEINLAKAKGGIYQQQLLADQQALQRAQEKSQALTAMQGDIGAISGHVQGLQQLAQQNVMMGGELVELNNQIRAQKIESEQQKVDSEAAAEVRGAAVQKLIIDGTSAGAANAKIMGVKQ